MPKKQIIDGENTAAQIVSIPMDINTLYKQMDDILVGTRKNFSPVVMAKNSKYADSVLRYVFEDYLGMTPREVRDKLTLEIIELLRIKPVIQKQIECPAELDSDTELQYIAWHLYPQTRNATNESLIIKVYMEMLSGKRRKYPKRFFDNLTGENRAKILLKIMINEYICAESIESLYALFADNAQIIPLLNKYKLNTPIACIYESPLEYLHESLGRQGRDDLFELYRENSLFEPAPTSGEAFGSELNTLVCDLADTAEVVESDFLDYSDDFFEDIL
jgi:hypothetical protein